MGIILLVTLFIGVMTVLLMNDVHKKEIKELELIIENFEDCFAQKSERLSTLHDDYWKLESRYTKKVREVESVWDKIRHQECVAIDFSKEITKLKEENLKLSEQLSGQQKAYKLLTDRLHRTIQHDLNVTTQLSATEHDRNVLQNHLTEVKDNFDSLQKEYDNLYGENVSLKEDVEHLEDEIEIKSNRIQELGETVQTFEEEVFKRDSYVASFLDAVNHSNTFEECIAKVNRIKQC